MSKFFYFNKPFFFEKNLIILIPFLFIFSRLFLEISLIYLTISAFINIYKNKEFEYLNNNFFKIFIFFYLIILFCYFLKKENFSDESIFFYFRYGFYVVSIFYFLTKIINLDQLFFASVKISILLLFLMLICNISLVKIYLGIYHQHQTEWPVFLMMKQLWVVLSFIFFH